MQKEQIFEFINKNPVIFLATVEGSEPRVRGMMLYKADESGIVFHTASDKDVCRQIQINPSVQMCFFDPAKNVQIRVRGTLEMLDDVNLKEEITNHPSRAFMQGWMASMEKEKFLKWFSVFSLRNGKANVWKFETNFTPKTDINL
jgi:uncharacterized pyridoxamine 5'-phosphate oxidase family protein